MTTQMPAAPNTAAIELDCRQIRGCSMILEVARVYRELPDAPTRLVVRADHPDFAVDIRAWAKTTGTSLRLETVGDETRAHLDLHPMGAPVRAAFPGAQSTPNAPRTPHRLRLVQMGLLEAMETVEQTLTERDPDLLEVHSEIPGIDVELRAWCRRRGWQLSHSVDGAHHLERAAPVAPVELDLPGPARLPPTAGVLDLRHAAPGQALLQLASTLIRRPRRERLVSAHPGFAPILTSWCEATGTIMRPSPAPRGELRMGLRMGARTTPSAPAPRAACLLLTDHIESLLAALMVADVNLVRGLGVTLYLAGDAVALLHRDRPLLDASLVAPDFLRRVQSRAVASGRGTNPMAGSMGHPTLVDELLDRPPADAAALFAMGADLGLEFDVSTMSLTREGLLSRDVVPLENLGTGGLPAFLEDARTSQTALVF